MRHGWLVLAAALALPAPAAAQSLAVTIDVASATAVLKAVRNPQLSLDEALRIARLPGNQGLIRKAKSYGRTADDALFAKALVAAARRDDGFNDISRFEFVAVRDHAAQTQQALADLADPKLRLIDAAKARIASFTPPGLTGTMTGYLVAGGTSGGFAFGEPMFYLNVDYYPSAGLAATILQHELYHAVQAAARAARPPGPAAAACLAKIPHGEDIDGIFGSLAAEGTASYVGDVLALPKDGADAATAKERRSVARNVGMSGRSITQLELSVHGLTTGAGVTPDEVYELGFYGDEVLYGLGYVMARAIAAEHGNSAIAALISQPGAAFVQRYAALKAYGKTADVPALKRATIDWSNRLAACGSGD